MVVRDDLFLPLYYEIVGDQDKPGGFNYIFEVDGSFFLRPSPHRGLVVEVTNSQRQLENGE